jgi:hypothetical protein
VLEANTESNTGMQNFSPHPLAECFPLLPLVELQTLALDIAKNGLIHPVVIFEGKILEGRNRYRACQWPVLCPRVKTTPARILGDTSSPQTLCAGT